MRHDSMLQGNPKSPGWSDLRKRRFCSPVVYDGATKHETSSHLDVGLACLLEILSACHDASSMFLRLGTGLLDLPLRYTLK